MRMKHLEVCCRNFKSMSNLIKYINKFLFVVVSSYYKMGVVFIVEKRGCIDVTYYFCLFFYFILKGSGEN